MKQARAPHSQLETGQSPKTARKRSGPRSADTASLSASSTRSLVGTAFAAEKGLPKADASHLFRRVAATSALPAGKLRAELIPDSSWKRARKTLGPQASQTAARLNHVLSIAERVWGSEVDATEWLNSPHPELQGATPLSMLRTEAGGRAIEALLGALDFGFPV
jgi:putative toxin-antitoxin system antitoxin component (TIGR02293 family)